MKVNILKAPDPALHKVCSDVDLGDPRMCGLDALQVGEAVR